MIFSKTDSYSVFSIYCSQSFITTEKYLTSVLDMRQYYISGTIYRGFSRIPASVDIYKTSLIQKRWIYRSEARVGAWVNAGKCFQQGSSRMSGHIFLM